VTESPTLRRSPTRLSIALALVLSVAALHIVNLRTWLPPALRIVHSSYFSDVAIPFAFYFLLCLTDDRAAPLRSHAAKALTVFLAASCAELLQGVGIPFLGSTFDPWDIVMYACGVGLATLLDWRILSRHVRAWPLSSTLR